MNLVPPAFLDLRLPTRERRWVFHLWLPLFLLWPLLWLLELLVLVPAVLADVILWLAGREYHYYAWLLLNCFGLLGDARGLTVHVKSSDADIDIVLV